MEAKMSSVPSAHNKEKILKKLEEAGLNDELCLKIIDSEDNECAIEAVKFIQNRREFNPTASQKKAKEIMGENFFGVRDAVKCFKVDPTEAQLKAVSEIPYSEKTLIECKHTHMLIVIFPVSILDIKKRVSPKLFSDSYEDDYKNEKFANDCGDIGWQLVDKFYVSGSIGKKWKEQQDLVSDNEKVPTARIMIYTIIGHHLKTGRRLFEHVFVRTSSLALNNPEDSHVFIGYFDSRGIRIYSDWRHRNCMLEDRVRDVGIAVSRKRQLNIDN